MAFSLETALIVPLVIGSFLGVTLAGVPAAIRVCQAARLEGRAIASQIDSSRMYQSVCLRDGSAWTTGLQASPQMVLEFYSLARDDCRLIGRNFTGLLSPQGIGIGETP